MYIAIIGGGHKPLTFRENLDVLSCFSSIVDQKPRGWRLVWSRDVRRLRRADADRPVRQMISRLLPYLSGVCVSIILFSFANFTVFSCQMTVLICRVQRWPSRSSRRETLRFAGRDLIGMTIAR